MRKGLNLLIALAFYTSFVLAGVSGVLADSSKERQLVSIVSNDEFAQFAFDQIGKQGWNCKEFANYVAAHFGISLGGGYYTPFKNAGREIDHPNEPIRRGDFIQLIKPSDPDGLYDGMHTAIVWNVQGNSEFEVIHSNWTAGGRPANTVAMDPNWRPQKVAAQHDGLEVCYFIPCHLKPGRG